MSSRKSFRFFFDFGLVFWIWASFSCGAPSALRSPDERAISAYTYGDISPDATIKVVLAKTLTPEALGAPFGTALAQSPLKFQPAIAGHASWTDGSTLEFRPDKALPRTQKYLGRFEVPGLDLALGADASFDFEFRTLPQVLEMKLGSLRILSPEKPEAMEMEGRLLTADAEDATRMEQTLSASHNGSELKISWNHSQSRKDHRFTISGIVKTPQTSELVLSWNGRAVEAAQQGVERVAVPAVGDFSVMNIRAVDDGSQFVEIGFSDPVRKNQDLRGLIRVEGREDLKYSVESNRVRVYSQTPWTSPAEVRVEMGIQSVAGYPLKTIAAASVPFPTVLPQVKFSGKGVIVPTSQGLTVPIETMNLNGVMVEALQIFGDNMPQFLQVNGLGDSRELNRVGKTVWKEAIAVDWKPDQADQWIRRGLDLSPLIKKFPTGMFRLKLTFRRQHIEWNGTSGRQFKDDDLEWDSSFQDTDDEGESSYWDYWENKNYDEYYSQRNNPLHPAFYSRIGGHDITVYRNVLISNIGLASKKSPEGTYYLMSSDIRTAAPKPGVKFTALDFQGQPVAKGETGSQAVAPFKPSDEPFLIVAEADGQYGFLKLDQGSALNVSHFDVGGERNEKGLNGFIYGERGVWRPGDDIYLTFILLDPNQVLPANHPVVLELVNPQGQVAQKLTKTAGLNGFYAFQASTASDAPTGAWMARVKVGGRAFEKSLKIETVMPNRLKIELKWKQDLAGLSAGPLAGELFSRWLHGATAGNLEADINVSFTPIPTAFSRWPEYAFDDPARRFSGSKQEIFKGRLNSQGKADVDTVILIEDQPPGKLMAHFTTRVFEPSGVFSTEMASFDFHPYSRYVGLSAPKGDAARGMLLTDTDHTLKIVLVDKTGEPVARGRVQAELLKVNWRWWWETSDDTLAEYVTNQSYRSIKVDTVNITGGKGEWKFRVNYPDWGRYLLRVKDLEGGHSTGKIVYIDWPGWAGRAQGEGAGGANMLMLSSDQKQYQVGQTVNVAFPSSDKGQALVSLEAGGKLVKSEWIKPDAGQTTKYSFKATEEMAPNLYVHVTFLQPHLQTANDLPIRVYGVLPVLVDNPASHLSPVIGSAESFEPASQVKITVKESAGRPMTYTLAVVDEGLLGITGYKTPDPWKHFYRREASLVRSWDLYDLVAGAWAGELENLLAIGGDGDNLGEGGKKKNRFPPVVKFIAPTQLAPGATNTHTIDLPMYVGEVRIMAVAADKKAFGISEKSVQVKSPLMVLPTLPRVLSPGEEIEVPVSVFSYEPSIKNVTVKLALEGPISFKGPETQTLSFSEVGDQTALFKLKVGNSTGNVRIVSTASAAAATATQTTNLEIRVPSSPVAESVLGPILQPGKIWKVPVELTGYAGTNSLQLEVSQITPIDLGRRVAYLIQYPHGCIEQTTSSVFPQLFMNQLVDLDAGQKTQIQNHVTAGIQRLTQFQTPKGGFSYWPGEMIESDWGSNYAGHFLLEAQRLGYAIPGNLLEKWKDFQKERANTWSGQSDGQEMEQAYRLFTLALAGAPDLGAMNRLKEADLPVAALWRLAGAYHLSGQQEAAQEMTLKASLTVGAYKETGGTFGSDIRDKAMILEILSLMNKISLGGPLALTLSQSLSSSEEHGTQTTAYALLALSRYAGSLLTNKPMSVSYSWNEAAAQNLKSVKAILQQNIAIGDLTNGTIEITNTGTQPVTPKLIVSGIPVVGTEKPLSSKLQMEVNYLNSERNPIFTSSFSPGADVFVEVNVTNPTSANFEQIALSHLLPAGWELQNSRLAGTDPGSASGGDDEAEDDWEYDTDRKPKAALFDYQDIRDDRVYTYFSLSGHETKTFRIMVTNTYKGRFYLPLITATAMYDASIRAIVPGKWITIGESQAFDPRTFRGGAK